MSLSTARPSPAATRPGSPSSPNQRSPPTEQRLASRFTGSVRLALGHPIPLRFLTANNSSILRQAHRQNAWAPIRNSDAALWRRQPRGVFRGAGTEQNRSPRRKGGYWLAPLNPADR